MFLWAAVGCVAAVLIEVALFTNGFGLVRSAATGGGTPSPGPNPNPYAVNVTSVTAALVFNGKGTNPFPFLVGGELCSRCPQAPQANANYSSEGAVLLVYFNVTNSGENWTTLGNFTLTTSGPNPSLFTLNSMQVGPAYGEPTPQIGFTPGQTDGLLAFISVGNLTSNGGVGYALTLHMTCP